MKKNSVITIVITALLCLALFSGVSAARQAIRSENIIGSLMEKPLPVTFSEAETRTTLYIEKGNSFGENLRPLPTEGTWQWADADGNVLKADTVVEAPMTVYAVRDNENNADFMKGASGILTVGKTDNSQGSQAMMSWVSECVGTCPAKSKSGCDKRLAGMDMGIANEKTPTVWTFEYAESCKNASARECFYYIQADNGLFLNITSSGVSTGSKMKILVKAADANLSSFTLWDSNGTYRANLKSDNYNCGFQSTNQWNAASFSFYQGGTVTTYTVEFNVNGGNYYPAPYSRVVNPGQTIELPDYTGTKNGHQFLGWMVQGGEDLTVYKGKKAGVNGDSYVVNGNVTFLAVYDTDPILWLDLNGGTGTLDKYSFKLDQSPVTLPGAEKISREGYSFIGWSADNAAIVGDEGIYAGETRYTIPDSGDTVLYAVWQNSVTVKAAASLEDEPVTIGTYAVGDKVNLTEALAGYGFDIWFYYGRNNVSSWYHTGDQITIPDHDVILYGAKQVTVTFDPDNGSSVKHVKENMLTGEAISLPEVNALFNTETETVFGWEETGSGSVYTDTYVVGQTNASLKAVWKYTVTFEVGGGSAAAPAAITGFGGDEQVLPDYEGKNSGKYDFVGWITVPLSEFDPEHTTVYPQGASLFDDGERLPRANTYYALYKVPVTFNPNNGTSSNNNVTGGSVVKVNNSTWVEVVDPGTQLNLASYTASGRSKRVFLGWAETTEAQVKISTYTVTTGDSTLYAIWGSTVTFADARFGSIVLPDPQTGFRSEFVNSVDGYESTWLAPAMSSDQTGGYQLMGWANSQNSTSVNYTPGQRYDFPKEDATYYAVWSDRTTVTYKSNDGTDTKVCTDQAGIKKGGDILTMPGSCGMTREGYTFGGWSQKADLYTTYNAVYAEGDKYEIPMYPKTYTTFYAIWNKTTGRPPLKFGIYLTKGTVLTEPVASGPDYNNKLFTTKAGLGKLPGGGNDWGIGNYLVTDALKEQHWVIDMDKITQPPVGQCYLENDVTRAIVTEKLPDETEINRMLVNAGVTEGFNCQTEYVLWYVIKHKTDAQWNGTTYEGEDCWHVDGTILKRNTVHLRYVHGDTLPSTEHTKWSLPGGKYEYVAGSEATVQPGSTPASNTALNGYSFVTWVDETGKEYAPGSTFTINEDMVLYSKFNHDFTTINITKIWNDGGYSNRPRTVTMDLYANGAKSNEFPNGITFTGTGDTWNHEVKVYAKDGSGVPITYTVKEKVPTGYTDGYSADKLTVTNTLLTNETVIKKWSDGYDAHAGDKVTVQLQQNGTAYGYSVDLNAANDWTNTVSVPKYDADGEAYTYSWVETYSPENYEVDAENTGRGTDNVYTITNKVSIVYLTITAEDKTKVYGSGDPTFTCTYSENWPADYEKFTPEYSRVTGEDVGTYTITPSGIEEDGIYRISYETGTLTITPLEVTVTVGNKSKVYGTADPATRDGWGVTYNPELVNVNSIDFEINREEGENVKAKPEGSEHYGTYTVTAGNVPGKKIIDEEGWELQGNYKVKYVAGSLEITPATVTVSAVNLGTKTYGDEIPDDTATVEGLVNNDDASVISYDLSRTLKAENDGGSEENSDAADDSLDGTIVGEYIITPYGNTEQGNYIVNYVSAGLTINPKPLTITAGSDTKEYDGTALTKNSYTNTDLATGDSITSVTVTGSQTYCGTAGANVASNASIVNAAGKNVTKNYEITYADGTLEIKPKTLTITADGGSKQYDGKPLTVSTYTNTDLVTGDKIVSVTVAGEGSLTEVNTYPNKPSAAVIKNQDGKGIDVTNCYAITYSNGTLEITPKPITITANDDKKVYDGTELKNGGYDLGETALADTDKFAYVAIAGSQTEVGTSDNVVRSWRIVRKDDELKDVTTSYTVTSSDGELEVTKRPLTITADDAEKVYDGSPLTKDSYTYELDKMAGGERVISVKVEGSQTVAGSSANVASDAVIWNSNNEPVTKNYEIKYVDGTLLVTENKAVIITAASDSKVYDGTALTNSGYTVTGLATGDRLTSVTITGTQTIVGSSENVPSNWVIVNSTGENVNGSYEVLPVNGTLTVTPKALTVTAAYDSKIYDGTALKNDGYSSTVLAEGDSIVNVTVTGTQTIAGTADNVPSDIRIENAAGEDVTGSYAITAKNGSLVVSPKSLTIKARNDSKVYDGTPLTNDGYTNTSLAAGDSIDSVTVTGAQTIAGSSNNVPSGASISNAQGEDVTGSYKIKYSNGTLKVTARPMFVIANSDVKIYDAAALTANGYTSSGLVAGDSISRVEVSGSRIPVGYSSNTASGGVITNEADEDVTESYSISYIAGRLTVNPRPVVVTADNKSKEFGQLDPEFTARVDGVLGSDTVAYEFTRAEGEEPGEYEITVSGEKLQGNYDVKYRPGVLTIVYNPSTYTAAKVWDDDNDRDGIRPISLAVTLIGSDNSMRSGRVSAANGWTTSFNVPLYANGLPVTYEMFEEDVNGYTGSKEVNGNVTTFTNTHAINRTSASVTKIWDDNDNKGGTRPATLPVILRGNGATILGRTLSAENNWSVTAENLPMNQNGSPINYVWYEQSVGAGYYAVSSTTSANNTRLVNSNLFTLTIHYQYPDGTEASADYVARLGSGEDFTIESPVIEGYNASQTIVLGIMPGNDLEITVTYTAEGEVVVTATPTPMPRPDLVVEESTPEPTKDVPEPRETEPDEEHPVTVPVPNLLVDIDGFETPLGLGEVFINNGGYSIE